MNTTIPFPKAKRRSRVHSRPSSRDTARKERHTGQIMFYEPGKTDHNLPYDPFKVRPSICPSLLYNSREEERRRTERIQRKSMAQERQTENSTIFLSLCLTLFSYCRHVSSLGPSAGSAQSRLPRPTTTMIPPRAAPATATATAIDQRR